MTFPQKIPFSPDEQSEIRAQRKDLRIGARIFVRARGRRNGRSPTCG